MPVFSRSVQLLLIGLLLLTVTMAVLNTLTPLWLHQVRFSSATVGMVSSAYFVGNLFGTLVAGHTIHRLGFNRSYYLACGLFALATLGLYTSVPSLWQWLLLRALAGITCALIWVIVESALLSSGLRHQRGKLLAAYMMVYYLGTLIGQMLLSVVSTQRLSVIPWTVILTLIAILPLCFAYFMRAGEVKRVRMRPMFIHTGARLGIWGCIISGIILGALYGLLPLYLAHQGETDGAVGRWMAWMVLAGILGQWPVGRFAEQYGRLAVLKGQVVLTLLGCSVMLMYDGSMLVTLLLLGISSFTLYPVAMAWACEQVEQEEVVAMNQALLLSYTIGSLFGPIIAGGLMQYWSDNALFLVIAVMALFYGVLLMRHRQINLPRCASH